MSTFFGAARQKHGKGTQEAKSLPAEGERECHALKKILSCTHFKANENKTLKESS